MITTKNLIKHFPNERAIRYQDLVFEDGKSYMLLGASGCGKSTLLNMIAGILSPEEGNIFIGDEDVTRKTQKEKDKFRIQKIGYIFQDFKLISEMTVMDNINILRLEKVNTANAEAVLAKLGLRDKKNKKVKHLFIFYFVKIGGVTRKLFCSYSFTLLAKASLNIWRFFSFSANFIKDCNKDLW